MDKRFVCAAILVAAVGHATTASAQVGGGVKVGVNLSSVSGDFDSDVDTKNRTGLVAGGFLTFAFAPALAFEADVLFSDQGVKLTAGTDEAKAKFGYVQVQPLLRVGNSGKGVAGVYGLFGPSFGFLNSAKITQSGQPEQDIKDDLKSSDVGFVAGVGFTLSRLLFEGRYTAGLKNINDDGSNQKNKNRVFSALVGIHF